MSERNVELARGLVEAYNTRDLEAYIACFDQSIELHSAFAAVGGAVYHGHGGVRRYFQDLADTFAGDVRIEPEAYFDLGNDLLAFYVLRGRGRHSGAEVAMQNAIVLRWRDDRVVYFRGYAHREDALSDLDVSEDDLEPIAP